MDLDLALALSLGYVLIAVVGSPLYGKFGVRLDMFYMRVLHNFLMTIMNGYMAIEIFQQAYNTSFYGPIFRDQRGLAMAKVLWMFYASKLLEFNDTFIMIFRKSTSQISFLHVYHHSSVFLMWWINVYFYPGGEAYVSAWMNSFVHVWMYGHYFLATLGYSAWWKRYITTLQIAQLGLFVVQGFSLFTGATRQHQMLALINCTYATTLFVLFIHYYRQNYGSKHKKEE